MENIIDFPEFDFIMGSKSSYVSLWTIMALYKSYVELENYSKARKAIVLIPNFMGNIKWD